MYITKYYKINLINKYDTKFVKIIINLENINYKNILVSIEYSKLLIIDTR